MYIRLLIAAAAVVAIPIAAAGQHPEAARKSPREKRYCEARADIASRLSNTRRCFTKAEWDAMKQEARQVVDRIQTMKASNGH